MHVDEPFASGHPLLKMAEELPPRRLPIPEIPRSEAVWLSRSYHHRVKATINVTIGVAVVGCLLYDWRACRRAEASEEGS